MPQSRTERNKFALPEYKIKKSDVSNKAVLRQDKLYLKGKLQFQYLKPILPVSPISLTPDTQSVKESREKRDGGNTFKGYAASVSDLKDIARIRQHLLCRPDVAGSTHVIYAYRLDGRGAKKIENFDSDRDWGTGNALLNMMRDKDINNTLCIATRTYNADHIFIGNKRFQIINDLCNVAYNQLQ